MTHFEEMGVFISPHLSPLTSIHSFHFFFYYCCEKLDTDSVPSVVKRVSSHPHIRSNGPLCVNHFCELYVCVHACLCACACVLLFVLNVVRWLGLKLPFNLTESVFNYFCWVLLLKPASKAQQVKPLGGNDPVGSTLLLYRSVIAICVFKAGY